MNLTLQDKYDIIIKTLHAIGSYEYCDCGCPHKRQARIAGTPAQVWTIANDALKAVGEEIKIYEDSTYRQGTQSY